MLTSYNRLIVFKIFQESVCVPFLKSKLYFNSIWKNEWVHLLENYLEDLSYFIC